MGELQEQMEDRAAEVAPPQGTTMVQELQVHQDKVIMVELFQVVMQYMAVAEEVQVVLVSQGPVHSRRMETVATALI
jgi:hypothetical protein